MGLAAKMGLTAALLIILVIKGDWHAALQRAAHADIEPLALAVTVIVASIFIAAARWRGLMKAAGMPLPYGLAARAMFTALFMGQFLPATVGSDAARLWFVWRAGFALRSAAGCIVLDRVAALLGVLILFAGSLPRFAGELPRDATWAALAAAGIMAAGLTVILLLDRLPLPRLVRDGRLAWVLCLVGEIRRGLCSRAGAIAIVFSTVIHTLSVVAVVLIIRALGLTVGYLDATGITAISLLLSSIPISLNGWGVREGAMVTGFGLVGISHADGLLVSVLFGLCAMAATLPGSLMWLTMTERSRC